REGYQRRMAISQPTNRTHRPGGGPISGGRGGPNGPPHAPFHILAASMAMTPDDLKHVFMRYEELLIRHRAVLDGLNVYPVPDGDTGATLLATVSAVNARLAGAESMGDVAAAIADGSLRGATGNSGLILSLILRGMASALG